MAIRKFKVFVTEKKTREGKAFTAYRAEKLNGDLITCKFRKEITPPTESCTCIVDSGDEPILSAMNVNKNKAYPELWISMQPTYEPFERNSKAEEELNEMFGEE